MDTSGVASEPSTHLRSTRLALARGVCIAIIVLNAVLFCVAIPARYQQLQRICVGAECESDNALVSEANTATLDQLGISLPYYALYHLIVEVGVTFVGWAVALLILIRKSDDLMALLVALCLGSGALATSTLNALPAALPSLWLPVTFVQFCSYTTLILVFYLFPNGRFVPNWTLWLWLILFVNELIFDFWPAAPFKSQGWYELVEGSIWIGSFIAIVVMQVYRYRYVSNAAQRLQTKWVVLGLTVAMTGLLTFLLLRLIFGFLLFSAISPLLLLLVPMSFGVAILRHRLWDIDIIIRRTLVYGVLTALLALVFFGSIIAIQAASQVVLRSLPGQTKDIALVASTLIIAALAWPLRNRIQAVIDRRFYRRKYDAEKTLEAFAARLQSETDEATLAADLKNVIQETLQPKHVKVWLVDQRSFRSEKGHEGTIGG